MTTQIANGRWARAVLDARGKLMSQGVVTTGLVAVGMHPVQNELRAIVENTSTMGVSPTWARFWREGEPGGPEQAARLAEKYTAQGGLGQGAHYRVFNIDDELCPVLLDWASHGRCLKKRRQVVVRGVRSLFNKQNIEIRLRAPWETLRSMW